MYHYQFTVGGVSSWMMEDTEELYLSGIALNIPTIYRQCEDILIKPIVTYFVIISYTV